MGTKTDTRPLSLLRVARTRLTYLSGGSPKIISDDSAMDMTLILLTEPMDVKLFEQRELCILSWNEHLSEPFAIPLLSGYKIALQGCGFLLMISEDMIFNLQFLDDIKEDYQLFMNALTDFTQANSVSVEKTKLQNQLKYIYSDRENKDRLVELSNKVGDFIERNSISLSESISRGTAYVGTGIRNTKEKIILNTEKGKEVQVDPKWRAGLYYASVATGFTAKTTRNLLDAASKRVIKTGTRIGIQVTASQGSNSSAEMKALGGILIKTGKAAGLVVEGIFTGIDSIAQNISDSASEVAQHKYGKDFGEAAGSGLKAALNSYRTVSNVSVFGNPTRFATHIGKKTAGEVGEFFSKPRPESISQSISQSGIFSHPETYDVTTKNRLNVSEKEEKERGKGKEKEKEKEPLYDDGE